MLSTAEVTVFIFSSLNQWVLCLKALISHACQGFKGLAVASSSSQMQHKVMISTMLHIMIMIFSGADSKIISELWQTSWTPWQQRLQQNQQNGEENNDEDREPEPKVSLSLDFSDAIKQYEIIWLNSFMILWESLLCFKPELFSQFSLTHSHLQQNMQINHNIFTTIIKQNQTQKLFYEHI